MAAILDKVQGIPVPKFKTGEPFEQYRAREEKYIEDVKAYAARRGYGPERGELISFPVGDGKALYVVLSTRPLVLILITTGDSYRAQFDNRMTLTDVRRAIRVAKTLTSIFKGV